MVISIFLDASPYVFVPLKYYFFFVLLLMKMKNFQLLKYSAVVLFFNLLLIFWWIIIDSKFRDITVLSSLSSCVYPGSILKLTQFPKLSISSRIYHTYLQEITWQFINSVFCYIGSSKNNRTGFAYSIGIKIFSNHHRNSSSIFTAELEEIFQCLQYYLQLILVFLHSFPYPKNSHLFPPFHYFTQTYHIYLDSNHIGIPWNELLYRKANDIPWSELLDREANDTPLQS